MIEKSEIVNSDRTGINELEMEKQQKLEIKIQEPFKTYLINSW